jgi:hypothetical protein
VGVFQHFGGTYRLNQRSLIVYQCKGTSVEANIAKFVGFEVLTAVSTKMAVFWVVVPFSLVKVYQRFIALMMEAARTSETLVNFYQTTQLYKPEDSHLRCEVYFRYTVIRSFLPSLPILLSPFLLLVGPLYMRNILTLHFHSSLHSMTCHLGCRHDRFLLVNLFPLLFPRPCRFMITCLTNRELSCLDGFRAASNVCVYEGLRYES